MSAVPLTVVVPTFNEEINLESCLQSVKDWAQEIIVVDSGSDDATDDIAKSFGATVYEHAYANAPKQWEWILDTVEFSSEWILALDADSVVTPELRAAISEELSSGTDKSGYYVRHKQMFRGRFIKHGGIYPRYRLYLFRRDKVYVDEHDLVDQRFFVRGQAGRLEHDIIEDNKKDSLIGPWMRKQIAFAERAALEERNRRSHAKSGRGALTGGRNERVLWLKRRWLRLPRYWRSVGYFLYRYVFRLGFLDGRAGFVYHFSQALVFRVMLDARLEELEDR